MLYMWTYVVDAVSETVWGTIDPATDAYQEAANWTGVLYAIQAMGSVTWAAMLPRFSNLSPGLRCCHASAIRRWPIV